MDSLSSMSMAGITLFSFITSLIYSLSALYFLYKGLRWLDKKNVGDFQKAIMKIREESNASAIYYGMRWLGACLLIGMVMSR